MKEWWEKSSKILIDDNLDEDALQNIVDQSNIFVRSGIDKVFEICQDKDIPIAIVSAGLGNVIELIINSLGFSLNLSIFANFLSEDEDGKLTKRSDPIIVSMEKQVVMRDKYVKSHLILLGDMITVI